MRYVGQHSTGQHRYKSFLRFRKYHTYVWQCVSAQSQRSYLQGPYGSEAGGRTPLWQDLPDAAPCLNLAKLSHQTMRFSRIAKVLSESFREDDERDFLSSDIAALSIIETFGTCLHSTKCCIVYH